jgi:hypothetical protein
VTIRHVSDIRMVTLKSIKLKMEKKQQNDVQKMICGLLFY